MKKKRNLFTAMGAPSLFLIFAVLCMAVLALLSLGTSRMTLEMSRASIAQTSRYNEACNRATDLCLELEKALLEAGRTAEDDGEYFCLAEKIGEETAGASFDEALHRLTFEVKITEEQSLRVVLSVLEPGSESCLSMVSWRTVVSDTWEPQLHQPVFRGE